MRRLFILVRPNDLRDQYAKLHKEVTTIVRLWPVCDHGATDAIRLIPASQLALKRTFNVELTGTRQLAGARPRWALGEASLYDAPGAIGNALL